MSNFVVLAQRIAGQAMVATTPTTAQHNDARRMSLAHDENRARELNAIDVSPSATHTRGVLNQYIVPAVPRSGSVDFQDARFFVAQHHAQEADSDQTIGARMPAAIAAYTKARDSRIEFQSSFQALDIRV